MTNDEKKHIFLIVGAWLLTFLIFAILKLSGQFILAWWKVFSFIYIPAAGYLMLLIVGFYKGRSASMIINKHGKFRQYDTVIDKASIAYPDEAGLLLKMGNFWFISYNDGGEVFITSPDNLINGY